MFYLHLRPEVFTNYQMLESKNTKYIEALIKVLPLKDVYVDHASSKGESSINGSPLRYILSQPALKWAYYLAVLFFILYAIFNGKRRQRPIPIVEPVKNNTLEFVKTMAGLHLEQKNHKDMAQKQILFFLSQIRRNYHLSTEEISDDFLTKLSRKSGKEKDQIKDLFSLIKDIETAEQISAKTLMVLNQKIESFQS
ncbi:MAG: hypothetical protein C4K58_05170 [Flavobacteriaceae bacterium]|nr:MAG: hypothetical protein C4K58_05170 [Flavobacteriaceae bacterium]